MRILKKDLLTKDSSIIRLKIHSPLIAQKAKPGQFVILMVSEKGERIPLTIVDKDSTSITLIFQKVGYTTELLARLDEGDSLYSLSGPLGKPTPIRCYGKVICVGGGVGVGLLYPIVKALKEEANYVISIIGARTKGLLILEDEIRKNSHQIFITTDDGSYGEKGFTTDALQKVLKETKVDLVYSVGPLLMMKKVAELTYPYKIKTLVSLNPIMVDGTGMCGSCRVDCGGATKFACVDGPDFDAHKIDFDSLIKRNSRFLEEERRVLNEEDPF